MKKNLFSLGLIAVAAFTLTNCAQEIENPIQEPEVNGYPFEIVAKTTDTKTVNDGMATKWVAGDEISLFHVESGETEYSANNKFTITAENLDACIFTGTLVADLAEENDWYALYPHSDYIKTPGSKEEGWTYIGHSNGLNQTGYNSMASLKGNVCPLYGVAGAVEIGETPDIEMKHLSSVVEIKVTNNTENPLTITTASLTATEEIVGSYFIDVTSNPVSYTANSASKKATVNVSGGTELAKGESASLYVAIKPFTAANGSKLVLSVNGYNKELTLTKDVTFTAGKIKTINFAYDYVAQEDVEVPALAIPWYEDFSSMDLSNYVITNGSKTEDNQEKIVETKLFETNPLAGGDAPEILIASKGGSLTALLSTNGYVGNLTLTFKSNHADYITVTTSSNVSISKVTDVEYTLSVPEGVNEFDITLKNTASSNSRVDDIEIAKSREAQTLTFANEVYNLSVGSAEMISFDGQIVSGAKTTVTYTSDNEDVAIVNAATGAVTLTGATGTAVITAAAVQTSEYKGATAVYSVIVVNPNATVREVSVTYDFGNDAEVGFSSWGSAYASHTAEYPDAIVKFISATKQSSTITNMPVTKGQPVEIIMDDNRTLKSFDLQLQQWSSKAQKVTLHYSVNGGASYTSTTTTSSNFALAGDLPEGTNAIKFTFSSSSNQVGIASCELTFDVAE